MKMADMAWSWSRLDVMRQCPYRFYLQFITKQPIEIDSIWMDIGGEVHQLADWLVKSSGVTKKVSTREQIQDKIQDLHTRYPDQVSLIDRAIDTLLSKITVDTSSITESELSVSLDDNLLIVPWFSRQSFFRIKVDYIRLHVDSENSQLHIHIMDWKLGKKFVGCDQLEVYCSFVINKILEDFLSKHPGYVMPVDNITLEVVYLSSGESEKRVVSFDVLEETRKRILDEISVYSRLPELDPTPSPEKCSKCFYPTICKYSMT